MNISGGNKTTRIVRMVIDVLNVILGIAIVCLAVMAFINASSNMWVFPIIFLLGGAMNMITGIKNYMTDRKISCIIAEVAAVALFIVSYVCYNAIGG